MRRCGYDAPPRFYMQARTCAHCGRGAEQGIGQCLRSLRGSHPPRHRRVGRSEIRKRSHGAPRPAAASRTAVPQTRTVIPKPSVSLFRTLVPLFRNLVPFFRKPRTPSIILPAAVASVLTRPQVLHVRRARARLRRVRRRLRCRCASGRYPRASSAPVPHLRRDRPGLAAATSAPGPTGARPCHICAGTDRGSPLPHLRRDCAA